MDMLNIETKRLIYAYLVVQNEELKKQGFIPTADLLIENLEEEIMKKDRFDLDLAEDKEKHQYELI